MADGTSKLIEDVELGDMVWAADPETGEEGPREVTRLITGHGDKTLVDIEIDGATVTATDHHPIWVNNAGEWVDAEDLKVGDYLLDQEGVTLLVDDIDIYEVSDQTVHNLTVDDLHTFFVLAGDDPILTHNNNCLIPRNADGTFARGAGGETAETVAGRSAHLNYENTLGGGDYVFNRRLPGSLSRPDAVSYSQRIVRELKPNTPGAISAGRRQLDGYIADLTGQRWTGYVDTYQRPL